MCIRDSSYAGEADNPSSLNRYAYCANDPVNYADPSGHSPQSNIKAAYDAWKGGYLSYNEYADNVRLNGGTPVSNSKQSRESSYQFKGTSNSVKLSPSTNISNISKLSAVQQSNINSAYDAFKGGYLSLIHI